ncbi:MAG: MltA domain-containing protein, partial [Planctomycetota bacterium]|nr:MltA domain-containing protein [Planctomycetota bacterium]
DEPAPGIGHVWLERMAVTAPLERSLHWTRLKSAANAFPIAGVTHDRALRSLERFRELLGTSTGPDDFEARVRAEFQWYKSAGWDGRGGGVLFTAYCTPILEGSLFPEGKYRHPLYALPPDLEKTADGTILGRRTASGLEPYPTRSVIEAGFLGGQGLELAYLSDPLDAFIAHVNGSAIIRLPDGGEARFGYAGKNGRPYKSLGRMLVQDGHIDANSLSLAQIRAWASRHPAKVQQYLDRNDSFVFFQQINGTPRGSLNEEVTSGRTLATDKSLFPRGAICYVDAQLPSSRGTVTYRQLMFDQDTGGAIRTAGRADIYLGIGPEAERRAGATRSEGQLYYLFLKE